MAITIIVAIVAVAVALLIAVPLTCKVAVNNKAKKDAEVVGTAEDRARSIIDEALKTAETKKREALLEVKEESLRTKNELEKETKERRSELQKYERRVLSKEESVDKKADAVEKREAECTAKVAELQKREKKVDELEQKGVQELERISGLTSDQAKDELLRSVEDDVKVDGSRIHVRELGRLDAPGRPILFGTTEEFLRCFGVQGLEELPSVDPVRLEDFKAEAEEEIQLKLDI